MATKNANAEVAAANEAAAPTPKIDIEALRAEIKAEIKAEIEAEMKTQIETEITAKTGKVKPVPETEEQTAYANERVPYMLPYIEGEPEEVNVTINGKTIQILRGEQVQIPRKYAEVLDNQIKQQKFFRNYQKEKREQITEVQGISDLL